MEVALTLRLVELRRLINLSAVGAGRNLSLAVRIKTKPVSTMVVPALCTAVARLRMQPPQSLEAPMVNQIPWPYDIKGDRLCGGVPGQCNRAGVRQSPALGDSCRPLEGDGVSAEVHRAGVPDDGKLPAARMGDRSRQQAGGAQLLQLHRRDVLSLLRPAVWRHGGFLSSATGWKFTLTARHRYDLEQRYTRTRFKAYKGYDLTPYLPAIWWDVGELTPKLHYDLMEFMSWLGLDTVFKTFTEWCAQHNTQSRIQPHSRFIEEIIQGAGMTPRPETEMTTSRFAVVADPRKANAAGARFYGSKIASAEAYTYLQKQRYMTTLEAMKIATDAFLRDGVTQFYNHGFFYTPEMHYSSTATCPGPTASVPGAPGGSITTISPPTSAAAASCCGRANSRAMFWSISPQATVWTKRTIYGSDRRNVPYGDLPMTLVANGYDFDPVNDDLLQNRGRAEDGHIRIGDYSYRFLILPNTSAVPMEMMGIYLVTSPPHGGVVIALDETAVGLRWPRRL